MVLRKKREPTRKEVRQARAFLRARSVDTILPQDFAQAAKESGLTFGQLFDEITEQAQQRVNENEPSSA